MKLFKPKIIVFLSFISCLHAQYHTPDSPLQFDCAGLKTQAIAEAIQNNPKLYEPLQIDALKLKIKQNNNGVDNRISILKSEMSNLSMDKQKLLELKDIQKLRDLIKKKQENRKEIEAQIQADLTSVTYKGLYAVVLKDVSPLSSKESLAKQAEHLLAPQAIEDLNGIFISSLTVIDQFQLVKDKITSTVSGQMDIEKQYINRTFDRRTKYLCLVKVNVSPLKKGIKAEEQFAYEEKTHLALNLLQAASSEDKLRSFGVPSSEIENIQFEINNSKAVIETANQTARRRQEQILTLGNENLVRIDRDIAENKEKLYNRSGLLKTMITEKTPVPFDENRTDHSINKALDYFNEQLEKKQQALLKAKEQELIARFETNVTIEGEPAEDLAKTALDLLGQIEQSHSKVEQFIRRTEVENYMLTSDKQTSEKDMFRKPETLWLYPVPGDRDNFLLTVVVKFKVADISAHEVADVPKKDSRERSRDREWEDPSIVSWNEKYVEGGEFVMGAEGGYDYTEKPAHKVLVDAFWIDEHEVTVSQYCKFLNEKGNRTEGGVSWLDIHHNKCRILKVDSKYRPEKGYSEHPVTCVSWFGAKAFAEWRGKRLPTEAEWEYAAKGGQKSRGHIYSGSDNIDGVAWYKRNSGLHTHPISSKKPNELGIYDMSGNVSEWCLDWYDDEYYKKKVYDNPQGPSSTRFKVVRGGNYDRPDWQCTTMSRNRFYTKSRTEYIGFRCVRDE